MGQDRPSEMIEKRLLRAWRNHRKIHATATREVRSASRAATDEIAAAHQAGMSPDRIAAVLGVGIGAILYRLRDAERVANADTGK